MDAVLLEWNLLISFLLSYYTKLYLFTLQYETFALFAVSISNLQWNI